MDKLIHYNSKIRETIRLILFCGLIQFSCNEDFQDSEEISGLPSFNNPVQVDISGYKGNIMEPFIAENGLLFFNNLNQPEVNTDIHYARKIENDIFEYLGKLEGVNTDSLDGVPSMNRDNQLYFISTRSYNETLSTIYTGNFIGDRLVEIILVKNISRKVDGWVNFDAEISRDGKFLYFVDGRYDSRGGPYESNIIIAKNRNGTFERNIKNDFLVNVNSDKLEYAPCISSDLLELYFTRVEAPLSETSIPRIYVSIRSDIDTFFPIPVLITDITGFVEGPALSPDASILYYHKRENGKFRLYMVMKI